MKTGKHMQIVKSEWYLIWISYEDGSMKCPGPRKEVTIDVGWTRSRAWSLMEFARATARFIQVCSWRCDNIWCPSSRNSTQCVSEELASRLRNVYLPMRNLWSPLDQQTWDNTKWVTSLAQDLESQNESTYNSGTHCVFSTARICVGGSSIVATTSTRNELAGHNRLASGCIGKVVNCSRRDVWRNVLSVWRNVSWLTTNGRCSHAEEKCQQSRYIKVS